MRSRNRAMHATCASCGKPLPSSTLDEDPREEELCQTCARRQTPSDRRQAAAQSKISTQKNQTLDQETIASESLLDPDRPSQADSDSQPPSEGSPKGESFTGMDREEAHRRLLRARGFDLEYDPHGFRLKSADSKRGSSISELSPYEIVRLAAEIDGEAVPPEERMKCPNCEAVVSPSDRKCQWCSHVLQE